MKNPNCICFTIDKKEDIELSVYLRPEAIEAEYAPHTWNDSRKVNPPNDVVFRAEIHEISISGHKWVNYQCLIYKNNKWFFFRGGREAERVLLEDAEYIMFRPWED